MVMFCAAFGCNNKAGTGKGLSFHTFPVDETLRNQWTVAMKRDTLNPNARICSVHFKPEDFEFHFGQKRIKRGVVPSIFNFSEHVKKEESEPKRKKLKFTGITAFETEIHTANSSVDRVLVTEQEPELSKLAFPDVKNEQFFVKDEPLEDVDEVVDDTKDSVPGFSEHGRDFQDHHSNADFVQVLHQIIANQKTDKDDIFGNRAFLLSFLPMMNELSKEKNLEVRAKILQAFTE